jgi:hypothetical protein
VPIRPQARRSCVGYAVYVALAAGAYGADDFPTVAVSLHHPTLPSKRGRDLFAMLNVTNARCCSAGMIDKSDDPPALKKSDP